MICVIFISKAISVTMGKRGGRKERKRLITARKRRRRK